MNINEYNGDPRYWAVWEKMQLLQIEDVSTPRQAKNGTITWKLPIKNNNSGKTNIEVASFKTGYVRNNNSGYSNYQLNKRCEGEPEYFETAGFKPGETLYRKFSTRTCKLIPIEIDRLEYLISYCLKNYYIKHANFVANGKYIPKWTHEYEMNELQNKLANSVPKWKYNEAMNLGKEQDCGHYDRIQELESEVRNLEGKYQASQKDVDDMTQERDSARLHEIEDGAYLTAKYTDMCNKFESAAMELSDLHCSGKDSKIKELQQEMDNICEEHNSKDQKYTWSGGQITDSETGEIYVHEQHAYWNKIPNSVQVIVDGHRYNVK